MAHISSRYLSGYPTPVTDILIVDDDDKVLPPGDVGEIWVRGPHLMKEYYDDPGVYAILSLDFNRSERLTTISVATAKVFTKVRAPTPTRRACY